MRDFESVLDECLEELENGVSDAQACLDRHPEYAARLRPVLLTAERFDLSREKEAPAALKARARAQLLQHMQAHPRKQANPFTITMMRFAMSLAAILLALLTTGTVYAQSALPGDLFHGWKLASEQVWQIASPDPVGTQIMIAQRRLDELIAVRDDPALQVQALEAYLEALARLSSQMDAANQTRIQGALNFQLEILYSANIIIPGLEQELPAQILETPATSPVLLPTLPVVDATEQPKLVPTIQVPPPLP